MDQDYPTFDEKSKIFTRFTGVLFEDVVSELESEIKKTENSPSSFLTIDQGTAIPFFLFWSRLSKPYYLLLRLFLEF